MSETPVSYVGIDDGFMETKVVLPSGKMIRIPSQIRSGEIDKISLTGAKTRVEGYLSSEGPYLVGDIDEADTTRQDEYPLSAANRVLVTHAMRLAGLGAEHRVAAVSGLPVKRFYRGVKLNKPLIRAKRENLLKNDITTADGTMGPKIVKHDVVSEGIAAWLDMILVKEGGRIRPDNGLAARKTAVIDMGGRTVDIAVIQDYDLDISRSSTIEVGMLDVQEAVAQAISDEFEIEPTVAQVNQAMQQGTLRVFGENRDVTAMVARASRAIVPRIQTEVNRRLGKGADIDQVIFAGGTAAALREHLDGWFPHQLISEEPAFANARGMAKYAEYMLGESG